MPDAEDKQTGVDHLHAMFDRNFDNLISSQIGADRGVLSALANDVGFIGLWNILLAKGISIGSIGWSHTLPVHAQSVLITFQVSV